MNICKNIIINYFISLDMFKKFCFLPFKKRFYSYSILKKNSSIKRPLDADSNILITSALPYVNNVPHLGNVIGCVLSADVFARYKRSIGSNVLFICGTDQYGTATEVKALKQKKSPKEICNEYFQIHKKSYDWFQISFDHFGRTSSQQHGKIVCDIFNQLEKNGYIVQKLNQQHFCSNCNIFLADRYVKGTCKKCGNKQAKGDQCDKCNQLQNALELQNAECSICNNPPLIKQSKHLYINLTSIQPALQKWIEQSIKNGIWSSNAISITKSWIKIGLKQRSISRDLKWGIKIPKSGFENKVFYVWFDAPIGYISMTSELLGQEYKQWWMNHKNNVKLYQFMGKDNVPFHSLIFPSSLIGTGMNWNLVNSISATEFLNYQGTKFSKSQNTGIFCDQIKDTQIEVSLWRYYLLTIRPQKCDTNFEWDEFALKVNNELVGNLGNLINRVLTFSYNKLNSKRLDLKYQHIGEYDKKFLSEASIFYKEYHDLMNKIELKQGLKKIMDLSSVGNKYLQDNKPWQKQNLLNGRSQIVIQILLNFINLLGMLIEPFVPGFTKKLNLYLGFKQAKILSEINTENFQQNLLRLLPKQNIFKKPEILVKPIKQETKNYLKNKFNKLEQI